MTTPTPADAVRQAMCDCTGRKNSDIAAAAIRAAANALLPRPAQGDQSPQATQDRLLTLQFLELANELAGNSPPAASREALAEAREESQAAAWQGVEPEQVLPAVEALAAAIDATPPATAPGEAQELAQWLNVQGVTDSSRRLHHRAAALLRQQESELATSREAVRRLVEWGGSCASKGLDSTVILAVANWFADGMTGPLPPLPPYIASREGVEPTPSSLDLQLVEIPTGRFLMGSPPSEEGHSEDEGPQHEVTLESFFLSRTPITQAQWREVAGWVEGPGERWGLDLRRKLEPSRFVGDNRPVEGVNWFEAMEFCSRLSQRSGKTYTLPSEAQWEYACRAGRTTPFHCGETLSEGLANYDAQIAYGRGRKGQSRGETTEVGRFPANDWGLHDMHGNVWEWCADHWHGSYDLGQRQAPGDGSPWLDAAEQGSGEEKGRRRDERTRVLRGGSWLSSPVLCRSAFRFGNYPADADRFIGFRVCCLP
jgi:formylglycine-generating enzyme required for sulfatase activity